MPIKRLFPTFFLGESRNRSDQPFKIHTKASMGEFDLEKADLQSPDEYHSRLNTEPSRGHCSGEKKICDGFISTITADESATAFSETEDSCDDQPAISRSTSRADVALSMVSRTLTLVRTRESLRNPGPPPDGGILAWSQVILAHLVLVNTWGYVNSFGIFQTVRGCLSRLIPYLFRGIVFMARYYPLSGIKKD